MEGVSLNVTCLVSPSAILSLSVMSDTETSSTYVSSSRSLECLGDDIRAFSVPLTFAPRTSVSRTLEVLRPRSWDIATGGRRGTAFRLNVVFTCCPSSESELKG